MILATFLFILTSEPKFIARIQQEKKTFLIRVDKPLNIRVYLRRVVLIIIINNTCR